MNEDVKIVNFLQEHAEAFKTLNEQWISSFFVLEKCDQQILDNPKKHILDKKGSILIALYNDIPIATCALIPMEEKGTYELAKMAVTPSMRGKKIGLKILRLYALRLSKAIMILSSGKLS